MLAFKTILLLSQLALLPDFPIINTQNTNEIQSFPEFHIKKNTTCIEVEGTSLSRETLLILSENREDDLGSQINQSSIINDAYSFTKSIEKLAQNSSTTFCGLTANTTYYLYSQETSPPESSLSSIVFLEAIQTMPFVACQNFNSTFLNPLSAVLLPLFSVLFLYTQTWGRAACRRILHSCRKRIRRHSHNRTPSSSCCSKDPKNNLSGCCSENTEKFSLQEIWERNRALEKLNQEEDDKRLCWLCCERPREVVFLDCGHIVSCAVCIYKFPKCPVDMKYFRRVYRFRVCDKFGISESFSQKMILAKKQEQSEQMQSALDGNFISLTGLSKLMEEATMEYDLLKAQNESYNYFTKCVICSERKRDVLFPDCCHVVCCRKCSEDVQHCPIDGAQVTQKYPVYFS